MGSRCGAYGNGHENADLYNRGSKGHAQYSGECSQLKVIMHQLEGGALARMAPRKESGQRVRLERAIESEPLLQPGPQNLQRIRVELAYVQTNKSV